MIKIIAFTIFALIILGAKSPVFPICNNVTAEQAVAPRIFAEQTIDGNKQNIILTRFLHNKFGILGSEFGSCYLNFFDFNLLYDAFTPIGLITFIYFVYEAVERKHYWLAIFLILPIVPFVRGPVFPVLLIYKLFAIIGLALLISKLKLK